MYHRILAVYEDIEHDTSTKYFLNNYEKMLHELFKKEE